MSEFKWIFMRWVNEWDVDDCLVFAFEVFSALVHNHDVWLNNNKNNTKKPTFISINTFSGMCS